MESPPRPTSAPGRFIGAARFEDEQRRLELFVLPVDWDDMGAAAALSTAAHTAYHLGAIRHIVAGLSK